MSDATKPSAEHLPLQTEALPDPSKALGVQQRKCDSEREEWCDGFLTANEMAAAMRRVGSALVPGADARGCGAKVDTMGKRFVTDEWCVSSCPQPSPYSYTLQLHHTPYACTYTLSLIPSQTQPKPSP